MSAVGAPVHPEESTDAVDEEMHFLRALLAPAELGREREEEAAGRCSRQELPRARRAPPSRRCSRPRE
eukprot:8695377-Alexandrium_andersonii.AAC.1